MAALKSTVVSVFRWFFDIKAADAYDPLPATKESYRNSAAADPAAAERIARETPAVVKFDTGSYMLSRI